MGLGYVFLSHYRRHPGQLIGLLLILICAAMLWSGVQSLTERAATSVAHSKAALEPLYSVARRDGGALEVGDFARLRRAGLCVTPRLEVRFPGTDMPALTGIDPFSAACLRQPLQHQPAIALMTGALDQPLLLGGADDLARWRRQVPADGYRLQPVEGVPTGRLLADIAVVARLQAGGEARLSLLLPARASDAPRLPEGYRVEVEAYGVEPDPLVDAFLLSLDALAALALLVAALLVRSVYRFALEQRRQSLLLLQRFGVPLWRLRLALGGEVLLLALIGSALGVWSGSRLAAVMADGFRTTLHGLFSVDSLAAPAPPLDAWLGMVAILALLVAWAALDLLRGRRPSAGRATGPGMMAAGLLILAATAVLVWSSQLWLIFLATGVCLTGAGLLLPVLLNRLLQAAERRCRDPLLEWSCSEMGALSRLLALPLMALAFAIAAAIGVQSMVTGFEQTFSRWLDQRLQGDLYLDPGRPVPPGGWIGQLERLPGVTAVLPMVRGRGLQDTHPVDVLAVDPLSPLLSGWRFLAAEPQPWAALAGDGILVNEQLARRRGLALGDRVSVRLGNARLSRRLAGIYADYGRPEGEVLLPLAVLPADLPAGYTTFVLGLAGGATPGWHSWPSQYPWLAGARLRDQAALKSGAAAVFENTFRMTGTLTGLTLALAGTALGLMGLAIFRLRQHCYSLLYVYGVTRRRLRRRLIVHAMLLTGLLSLLATPLGLFLGWVLVSRVNPAAFGWALPLGIYPGFWLQLWGGSLLIGAVVGWLQGDPVRLETLTNE